MDWPHLRQAASAYEQSVVAGNEVDEAGRISSSGAASVGLWLGTLGDVGMREKLDVVRSSGNKRTGRSDTETDWNRGEISSGYLTVHPVRRSARRNDRPFKKMVRKQWHRG